MEVLDLGEHPLANAYRPSAAEAVALQRYPLSLSLCEQCSLLQLGQTVDPAVMFEDYPYFSSTIPAVVSHAGELAGTVAARRNLEKGSMIVEVASNDGYLLRFYQDAGMQVLGVDPARNIAMVANANGVPTIAEFFSERLGEVLAGQRHADVIHASNVLAHVPDPNDVVAGMARLLADGGRIVIETPHVVPFVDKCEFDTTYHEHVFCYSLTALAALFERHGLKIEHADHLTHYHGGTLRVWVGHADDVVPTRWAVELLEQEASWGVSDRARYLAMAGRVASMRDRLVELLGGLRARGASVAAYGAAAKGNTLLNTFGIGSDLIDFVVDDSPHKQGLCMPGSGIPIFGPDHLKDSMPDYVLILAWNFATHIRAQRGWYERAGGRFIVPLPEPTVLH